MAEETVIKTVKEFENGTKLVEESGEFTIPKDSPVESEREKKQKFSFQYLVYPSTQVALADTNEEGKLRFTEKEHLKVLNTASKSKARANAYQSQMAKHKPSEMSEADAKESIVRALIRQGIPESIARAQVDSLMASKATLSEVPTEG